jgi:hypothetical protein
VDLHNADDSDYWRDISPIERIEAIEFMRKVMFGCDRVSERLKEFLRLLNSKEIEYLVIGGYEAITVIRVQQATWMYG